MRRPMTTAAVLVVALCFIITIILALSHVAPQKSASAPVVAVGQHTAPARIYEKPYFTRALLVEMQQKFPEIGPDFLKDFSCNVSAGRSRLTCEVQCEDDLTCLRARDLCEGDNRCVLAVSSTPSPGVATLKAHSATLPTPAAVPVAQVVSNMSLRWQRRPGQPPIMQSLSATVRWLMRHSAECAASSGDGDNAYASSNLPQPLLFSSAVTLDASRHMLVLTHVPKTAGTSAFKDMQLVVDAAADQSWDQSTAVASTQGGTGGNGTSGAAAARHNITHMRFFPPRNCQPHSSMTVAASRHGVVDTHRVVKAAQPLSRAQRARSATMCQAVQVSEDRTIEHESYLVPGCTASSNQMGAHCSHSELASCIAAGFAPLEWPKTAAEAAALQPQLTPRAMAPLFITTLREPVRRVLSEYDWGLLNWCLVSPMCCDFVPVFVTCSPDRTGRERALIPRAFVSHRSAASTPDPSQVSSATRGTHGLPRSVLARSTPVVTVRCIGG